MKRLLQLCLLFVLLFVTADVIAVFACGSLAPAKFTNTIGFIELTLQMVQERILQEQ